MELVLVVAAAENGVIGKDGAMPWHLPADLRHFRRITMGKPVIMGRKTWHSIGRPLPGRQNIVLTRDPAFHGTGAAIVSSLDEALAAAGGASEAMVIGGAEIYALARPLATRIELTRIHAAPEGDTYFPEPEASLWVETAREDHAADGEAPAHSFLSYARR
mgnify:CR=1 FL=1